MKKSILCCSLLAIAALAAGCSEDTANPVTAPSPVPATEKAAADYGINVIQPAAAPYGLTYEEWSVKWFQWLWSLPTSVNPGLDPDGSYTDQDQDQPVYFLGCAYYGQWEREVTVPANKMIFVDIAGLGFSLSMGDGDDEEEIREYADRSITNIIENPFLEVDGVPMQRVDEFRFESPPGLYDISLPEENVFQYFGYEDVEGGFYPNDGMNEGYFAILPPLSPGKHTVYFGADFGGPYNEDLRILYHVTVKGGKSGKNTRD